VTQPSALLFVFLPESSRGAAWKEAALLDKVFATGVLQQCAERLTVRCGNLGFPVDPPDLASSINEFFGFGGGKYLVGSRLIEHCRSENRHAVSGLVVEGLNSKDGYQLHAQFKADGAYAGLVPISYERAFHAARYRDGLATWCYLEAGIATLVEGLGAEDSRALELLMSQRGFSIKLEALAEARPEDGMDSAVADLKARLISAKPSELKALIAEAEGYDEAKLISAGFLDVILEKSLTMISRVEAALHASDLQELAESGENDIAKYREALAAGAVVDERGKTDRTALMWAAENCSNPEVIRFLAAAGADANVTDDNSNTALILAAGFNANDQIVSALLEAGALTEARDTFYGATALMYASAFRTENAVAVIEVLLEAGADLEARNYDDRTPLLFAAQHTDNPAVITALLKAGANAKARDSKGLNAVQIASQECLVENQEVVRMLTSASK